MPTKHLRTPIVKPRTQGGTFYSFSSALEDIGLNINELKNKVSLSHYVLLNIPEFDTDFNTQSESAFEDKANIGDYKFAEGFQNYVLNMEAVLRNQSSYNFAEAKTVSERVFWKWLAKSCMNYTEQVDTDTGIVYYTDSNGIAKGFGLITAGAQRSDDYSMYNETFVQIPSSYGQMRVLYKPVEDRNYYVSDTPFSGTSSDGRIENSTDEEITNGKLYTGVSSSAIYDSANGYDIRSKFDTMAVEFNIDSLRKYYKDESLTYDDIGIKHSISNNYEFNAILIYYSIYDSTGKNILATNAYGILILDSAQTRESGGYKFPVFTKTKSTESTTGSSYAFRLNVKTTSVYNGEIKVDDNSTVSYQMSTDFNDVIKNLNKAVETLRSNANVISLISSDNSQLKSLMMDAVDKVEDVKRTVNAILTGAIRNVNTNTLTANSAEIGNIMSKTFFYHEESGAIVGRAEQDRFSYRVLDSSALISDTAQLGEVTTSIVTAPIDDITFVGAGGQSYGKVSAQGVFSEGDYFIKETGSTSGAATMANLASNARAIIAGIDVVGTTDSYEFKLPESFSDVNTNALLETLRGTMTNDEGLTVPSPYINVSNLLALIVLSMKS